MSPPVPYRGYRRLHSRQKRWKSNLLVSFSDVIWTVTQRSSEKTFSRGRHVKCYLVCFEIHQNTFMWHTITGYTGYEIFIEFLNWMKLKLKTTVQNIVENLSNFGPPVTLPVGWQFDSLHHNLPPHRRVILFELNIALNLNRRSLNKIFDTAQCESPEFPFISCHKTPNIST